MFGKNKKSILLLLILFFWVGYVAVTGFQFYSQAVKLAENESNSRKERMDYILQSNIGALVQERPESVQDRLSQARKLHLIDFYILQKDQQVVFFENNTGKVEDLNHNYTNFNRFMDYNGLTFKTIKVLSYRLTAGSYTDSQGMVWGSLKLMLPLMIKDIGIVTLMVAAIAYFILQDILTLSRTLASRSRAQLTQIKTKSAEAETLLKASLGFEGERSRLEQLSETYGATVGPAIRHELNSGKEAPYSFYATMCRIDLNGYTQMFLEKKDTYLTAILNNYFERARDVIERYQGLIYQFVGDEIVFHFKDEVTPSLYSEALATACIRDLFEEAQTIEKNLPVDAGHYFKLKGSFAHGIMRFIQLDEGHALSGLPLIESVRLLSLVDEKKHQVLTYFQDACMNTGNLTTVFERKNNVLKGFKETSVICTSREFSSVETVLQEQNWSHLAYFRSDAQFVTMMQELQKLIINKQDLSILQMLCALRFHHFKTTTAAVIKEFENTLEIAVKGAQEGFIGNKALSSVLSLTIRVIPTEQVSEDILKWTAALMDHADPRVQANAVLTLGHFSYPYAKIWEKMFSPHNRVAADTIVEIAKQNLSEDLLRALNQLLQSPNEDYRKSGLYAREAILKYYSNLDPIFFETNPYINKVKQAA
ncbi:MAG: hypothetical protein AAGB31_14440 [Bdellovibrio sp.]